MAKGKTARRKAARKHKLKKRDLRVKGLLKATVRRKQLVRIKTERRAG